MDFELLVLQLFNHLGSDCDRVGRVLSGPCRRYVASRRAHLVNDASHMVHHVNAAGDAILLLPALLLLDAPVKISKDGCQERLELFHRRAGHTSCCNRVVQIDGLFARPHDEQLPMPRHVDWEEYVCGVLVTTISHCSGSVLVALRGRSLCDGHPRVCVVQHHATRNAARVEQPCHRVQEVAMDFTVRLANLSPDLRASNLGVAKVVCRV